MTPDELQQAALSAYERGRLWWAARAAVGVAVLTAIGVVATGAVWVGALGAVLAGAVVALRFRGLELAWAAHAGLSAGAVVFLAPLAIRAAGHGCTGCGAELAPCVLAGVATGVLLGIGAARSGVWRLPPLGAAAGVAGLTGALTCAPLGAGVTAGVLAAAAVAAAATTTVARLALR